MTSDNNPTHIRVIAAARSIRIRPDGIMSTVAPANGMYWSLDELQTIVEGQFTTILIGHSTVLIVCEDGHGKEPNKIATDIVCGYPGRQMQTVVGTVLFTQRKMVD